MSSPVTSKSTAVLVITDGRTDYLRRCVESARENLKGQITEWWMYDDTGDPEHRRYLTGTYPDWRHINGGPRQGFGGAIAVAWRHLTLGSLADHVFHLEQDFVFRQPVDVDDMGKALTMFPYLAQMALCRQPWSCVEHERGGVVEVNPEAYVQVVDTAGRHWLEHRLFWTTNPSLYRRSLCQTGWPEGDRSEGMFTHRLISEGWSGVPGPEVKFAYWGRLGEHVLVDHIGFTRAGTGY